MRYQGFLAVAITALLARPAVPAHPILICFHVPLTGVAAADGASARNGAELAVEQINAAGGIDGRMLELVAYDDQASPKEVVPIANRLIEQDKVTAAVSGSYSAPTRAAASIFQTANIPYVSAYAIHPDITRAGDYVFRTSFMGEVQGRAGAQLVGDLLQKKRVVMITLQNDFGKSLADGFREAAPKFGVVGVAGDEDSMKTRVVGRSVSRVRAGPAGPREVR